MDDPWNMLEELVQEVNRQTEQIKEVHKKVQDLSVSTRSKDGMVTVTVGPRGELRRLEFDPRVYRKLTPSELSAAITEQVAKATEQVSAELESLIGPFVPQDLPFESLFGEGVGFDAFLPRPVKPSPDGPQASS
ncbi:YbaB/EbfC family nucleoid-associated protein [Nonomuraea sp. B12E4]|uniref:YbaB/EbfC family nucleoid-associated protein n=1 Tax=Nonomuraea sp. B12E4 TaxID=3153564 RepID=UPI00325E69A7